jgi:hypothetical protein
MGECVDAKGNIWITDAGRDDMLEFAHAGTSPIRILSLPASTPYDFPINCSIDPTTGNLAVTLYYSVLVFRRARGKPTIYDVSPIPSVFYCGYDSKGDLFVDGLSSRGFGYFRFAELPKGESSFKNLALTAVQVPGDVAWDGKYLAVGDTLTDRIYQVRVTSKRATIVGYSPLSDADDPADGFDFPSVDTGTWNRQAKRVIADDFTTGVGVWTYPAGGSPTKTIAGDTYPTGIVVSRRRP